MAKERAEKPGKFTGRKILELGARAAVVTPLILGPLGEALTPKDGNEPNPQTSPNTLILSPDDPTNPLSQRRQLDSHIGFASPWQQEEQVEAEEQQEYFPDNTVTIAANPQELGVSSLSEIDNIETVLDNPTIGQENKDEIYSLLEKFGWATASGLNTNLYLAETEQGIIASAAVEARMEGQNWVFLWHPVLQQTIGVPIEEGMSFGFFFVQENGSQFLVPGLIDENNNAYPFPDYDPETQGFGTLIGLNQQERLDMQISGPTRIYTDRTTPAILPGLEEPREGITQEEIEAAILNSGNRVVYAKELPESACKLLFRSQAGIDAFLDNSWVDVEGKYVPQIEAIDENRMAIFRTYMEWLAVKTNTPGMASLSFDNFLARRAGGEQFNMRFQARDINTGEFQERQEPLGRIEYQGSLVADNLEITIPAEGNPVYEIYLANTLAGAYLPTLSYHEGSGDMHGGVFYDNERPNTIIFYFAFPVTEDLMWWPYEGVGYVYNYPLIIQTLMRNFAFFTIQMSDQERVHNGRVHHMSMLLNVGISPLREAYHDILLGRTPTGNEWNPMISVISAAGHED